MAAATEKEEDFKRFKVTDIKPYGDRVLLRQIIQEKSKGGIWLGREGEKNECGYGEVLAVGPGARCLEDGRILPMGVKKGQKVVYMKYAGAEIPIDGEEFKLRMIAEGEVWAIVEGVEK